MPDETRKLPPNLRIFALTFAFFAIGLLAFLAAMAAGIRLLPQIATEQTAQNPAGWLLAHAFLLGFASMIAMGASYQLTQVIMRTSLFSRTLGYVHLILYVLGVAGLLAGFAGDAAWMAWGGGGVALGVLAYAVNIVATFIRKREWNLFVFGVSLSLLSFLAMIGMGMAMSAAFANNAQIARYHAIFGTHLWLGLGGWLSGLILAYSFKLLPMFYVSRKKPTRSAYWLVGAFHAGIWLHVLGLWLDADLLAVAGDVIFLPTFLGCLVYFREVRAMSSGKQPIGVVKIASALLPVIFVVFAAWRVVRWLGWQFGMIDEALVVCLVLGWFAPSIFAYLSKIFPFLWWARRYRTKEEKKTAPMLSEMVAENRMVWELGGYLAGVAVVACGIAVGISKMVLWGQVAALACVIVYMAELLRVFRH